MHDLVGRFGLTPTEICNGHCREFARELQRLAGGEIFEAEVDLDAASGDVVYHQFLLFGGRYYDAEAPAGVSDWRRLPLYRNIFGPAAAPQMTAARGPAGARS